MAMLLDSGEPTGEAPEAPSRSGRRRALAIVVALGVVAAGIVGYAVTHRAPTPEEFASFAQKLDPLGAPAGSPGVVWSPVDPTQPGYNGTPGSGWQPTGEGTWTSTGDASSWVAVHGWQASVPVGEVDAACRAVETWVTGTSAALGVSGDPANAPTTARCRAAVDDALADKQAAAVDAWAGSGSQTGDGAMRYRTGAMISTAPPDTTVTFTVMADATRFAG